MIRGFREGALMAGVIVCPHCLQELRVANTPAPGTTVRCFVCKEVFITEVERPSPPPKLAARPAPPKAARPAPQRPQPQPRPAPQQRPAPQAQRPQQYPAQQPADLFGSPANTGFGQPNQDPFGSAGFNSPYVAQYTPPQPIAEETPPWVFMLTVGAGGFGVLVLCGIFFLAISSFYKRPTPQTVAQNQPAVVNQAPAPAPRPAVAAPAPSTPAIAPAVTTAPAPILTAPEPVRAPVEQPKTTAPPQVTATTPAETPNTYFPSTPVSSNNSIDPVVTPVPPAIQPANPPVAVEAPPADVTGLAYRWQGGQRYSYDFKMTMKGGNQQTAYAGRAAYPRARRRPKTYARFSTDDRLAKDRGPPSSSTPTASWSLAIT